MTYDKRIFAAPKRLSDRVIPVYRSSIPRAQPRQKTIARIILTALLMSFVGISVSHAQVSAPTSEPVTILAQGAPSGAGERRGPPPREALDACAKKSANAACRFAGPNGQKIQGTCMSPQANVPLACAPANPPKG